MNMNDEAIVADVLAGIAASPKDSKNTASKGKKRSAGESKEDSEVAAKRVKRAKPKEHTFAVPPRIIQVIKKPKTFMDHSYRDFSAVPPELDYVEPANIEEMTFSQQVHHMLSDPETAIQIAWTPHGRSFRILVPKMLESRGTLMKYFNHNRFSSFLRQLNNHGFKHLTQGNDRNCYYHELMLRGMPHLAKYMPEAKDARRLSPDPENEPEFENISSIFPVPGGQSTTTTAGMLEMTLGMQQQQQQQQRTEQHQQQRSQLTNSWLSSLAGGAQAPVLGAGGLRVLPDTLSNLVTMAQQHHNTVLPSAALEAVTLALQTKIAAQRQQQQQQSALHANVAAQQLQAKIAAQQQLNTGMNLFNGFKY